MNETFLFKSKHYPCFKIHVYRKFTGHLGALKSMIRFKFQKHMVFGIFFMEND